MSVTNTSNDEVLFDNRSVFSNEYDVNMFIWDNKQHNSFRGKLISHKVYGNLET